MAITYSISREERLIKAYATGIIRADDLHHLIKSLLADPNLTPGLRGLYDARHAEPDITVMQIAEVAEEVKQLLNRGFGRLAIVARSQASYRVAKTFSILARAIGTDVDVFRELPAAEAWLEEGNGNSGSPPGDKPLRP
jgi:hypothetical protein